MTQAVVVGGLFIGVLSALPVVNLANCCCLWVLTGGIITSYLAQQDDPRPLSLMAGARLGLRAGIFGAVVWLLASAAVDLIVTPLQRNAADMMLRNATDVPPDVRSWLQSFGGAATLSARMVFGFLFQLCIATPFASLGGLFGAALFGGGGELTHQP